MANRVFDIPRTDKQSTYGARTAYQAAWHRPWPFDDEYLRQIATHILPNTPQACAVLLNAMRECHVF